MRGTFDFAVVGGGIVGLATALEIRNRHPGASLVLLEKEGSVARHQSGRNSGVIHSGIYYKPGSLKARLAREGNASMAAFCREQRIPHAVSGKLIVATREEEIPRLEALRNRATENGVDCETVDASGAREIEPGVRCLSALRVPSTGVVDFGTVCQAMERRLRTGGAAVHLASPVRGLKAGKSGVEVVAGDDRFEAGFAVICAGLQSDRLARLEGLDPGTRIIPFRGEYFELREPRRHLVRSMVYPVPDPALPFLGVHFTRGIDGRVRIGPNAVLAFAREGYESRRFDWRDSFATLSYPGFWLMGMRNARAGLSEMIRSVSRSRFLASMREMIPEVGAADVLAAGSGIRAQALMKNGLLVDDFLFVRGSNTLHVCNAPSPAATASIEIGKMIADEVERTE